MKGILIEIGIVTIVVRLEIMITGGMCIENSKSIVRKYNGLHNDDAGKHIIEQKNAGTNITHKRIYYYDCELLYILLSKFGKLFMNI